MPLLLKAAPILLVLTAAPAFAQPANPHAGLHPAGVDAAPAKPNAKSSEAPGCPMMKGHTMGGQASRHQPLAGQKKGAEGKSAPGKMAKGSGGMMSGDHMQHCMTMGQAKAADAPVAKPGGSEHDHQQ